MIRCNPIKNGQYQRRDVTVVFDEDDFSKITIKQGDQQVCVGDAGFFADVTEVMKETYKAADKAKYDRINHMFAHMTGTSLSCPDAPMRPLKDIIDSDKNTDLVLDDIIDYVDDALSGGDYDLVNDDLSEISVDQYSVNILICLLTCSNWAKEQLPARKEFYQKVVYSLSSRGLLAYGLLDGLE